jgi:hypothetical protein
MVAVTPGLDEELLIEVAMSASVLVADTATFMVLLPTVTLMVPCPTAVPLATGSLVRFCAVASWLTAMV